MSIDLVEPIYQPIVQALLEIKAIDSFDIKEILDSHENIQDVFIAIGWDFLGSKDRDSARKIANKQSTTLEEKERLKYFGFLKYDYSMAEPIETYIKLFCQAK